MTALTRLPDDFVQALFEEIERAGHEYAMAKAERTGLEEDKKITRSHLMHLAKAEGIAAVTAQEHYAYGHPSYALKIQELKRAVRREVEAEYALKLIDMRFEAWRTLSANERAASR
jgi:hypothetical protein